MKKMDVIALKAKQDTEDKYILLDVREPHEVTFAKVDPHVHIPMGAIPIRYEELDKKIIEFRNQLKNKKEESIEVRERKASSGATIEGLNKRRNDMLERVMTDLK